jgi:hypothetical protein
MALPTAKWANSQNLIFRQVAYTSTLLNSAFPAHGAGKAVLSPSKIFF